jgi:hypothetical protein
VQELSGTERGLFATEDLVEGTTILSVPVSLTVTVQRSAATPLGLELLKASVEGRVPDEKSLDEMLLATWLLHETSQTGSNNTIYMDSLPRYLSTPFNLSKADVQQCLGGLAAEAYILRGQDILDKELAILQSLPASSGLDLSRERYLWARFMSFSRTFTVARLRLNMDSTMNGLPELPAFAQNLWASSKVSDEASVLVPLADMLNHAQSPNCDWSYSGRDGFTVKTKRPVAAGEELHISYGAKQNQLFLAHYGFVDKGTPGDKWDLTLQLAGLIDEDVISAVVDDKGSVQSPDADDFHVVMRIEAGNPSAPDELQDLLDKFRDRASRQLGIPLSEDSAVEKAHLTITLTKNIGEKLGIERRDDEITKIEDGPVSKWNSDNPDNQIKIGDRIVEINGLQGDSKWDIVREATTLKMGFFVFRSQESRAAVEAAALRLFLRALQREGQAFEPVLVGLPACRAYRENLRQLLGTWRVFAEKALALVEDSEPPDGSWLTVPRFLRYARLYFGLWLTGQGGARLAKSKEALQKARVYGKMSFFDAVYTED